MRCIIVGAGPVGCYAGYLLAKKGHEVAIYEEHKEIGEPFQCTGLLTAAVNDLLTVPKDLIMTEIGKIRVHSKNKSLLLNIHNNELVLDRTGFDRHIAELARKAGAKIYTQHRFIRYDKGAVFLHKGKEKSVEGDMLIGADGPNSTVRKLIDTRKVHHYVGAQATVKIHHRTDMFDTFFGDNFPYFFGWIVPINKNMARIGLAARKRSGILFGEFLDRVLGKEKEFYDQQGGLIPIYDPQLRVKKGNIMVLGDAGTHVKATTGGGIIPGMMAAKEMIEKISVDTLRNKDLKVHQSLRLHLFARKILDTFSDKEYDRLLKMSQGKVQHILEKESRDYPAAMVFKLIRAEPRLLMFTGKLITRFIRDFLFFS